MTVSEIWAVLFTQANQNIEENYHCKSFLLLEVQDFLKGENQHFLDIYIIF